MGDHGATGGADAGTARELQGQHEFVVQQLEHLVHALFALRLRGTGSASGSACSSESP